ncbi:MAG: CHASE2 domain-containing protein, partial [Candidatus Omnitrophota bacterium]
MFQSFKEKDFTYPFLIWCIVVFWYIILVYNFFELAQYKVQDFFASQSFYMFSRPPEQARDIVIVAIDEASRRELNLKWPWPRNVTAQLIRRVASFSPKVIGLDMIFSGESEPAEDDVLLDVFRSCPNIIAGYKLGEKTDEFPLQKYVQAMKAVGFVDKPLQASKVWKSSRSIDEVIRSQRTYYVDEKGYNFSIDVELAAAYLDVPRREIQVFPQKGIYLGKDFFVPSRNGVTPINYLLHYNEFTSIGASLVLNREIDPALFKDKIVLIGATDSLVHDEYLTPLGVLPGISIVGNSLLTMLSGRFVHNLSGVATLGLIFILGIGILLINKKTGLALSTGLTFLVLGGTFAGSLYLRAKDIQFDYFSVFFLAFAALVVSSIYKYSYITYMSTRLRTLAITDPLTGFYNLRYFLLKLDEEMRGASGDFVMFAISIVNYRKLALDLSFDELKSLVKTLSEYVEQNISRSFSRKDLTRISPDTLGIAVWNAEKTNTEVFLKDFLARINKQEFKIGEKTLLVSLQGALIYKNRKIKAQSRQIIHNLTALLSKPKGEGDNFAAIDLLEDKLWKSRKELGREDMLDFLTADLNERNKELEQTLRELTESKQETEEAYFEVI